MALPTRPPPYPITPVKREHDATELAAAGAHTPLPPQPPKKLRPDHPETPTQPLLTPQTVSSNTLLPSARAAMKTEPFADEVSSKSHATPPGVPSAASPPPPPTSDNRETEADEKATRLGPPRARPARNSAAGATIAVNRRRLGRLLRELVRLHRWREAAAAVSALIAATPRPASFDEARSTFVAAMDIQRRLDEDSGKQQHSKSRYFLRTQKLFDVWMRRLNWLPTCPGKHLVKLELALFHLSQGNIDNAYNATRTLLFKEELKTEPTLNLIHGLISYEKWYSGLPKDMQVKDFDVYKQSSTVLMVSNCHEEIGSLESSDDNCGINIDDASFSVCSSRSSIGNGKSAPKEFNRNIIKKSNFVEKSDSSGSQMIERMDASDLRSVFFNSSNTRTCGLEINLLPLRLKHVVGTSDDCFDSYLKYKSAPNAFYDDAEKCLRRALHSRPPLIAALLPLIQLLLLGDKLEDALNELEKTCHSLTTALPFRLRGRLLEYADQSQVLTISSCYEEALRRDPTCSYSMERLIKMHIKGYYNTIQLLEMIALHLDSSNGKPCIWEELVSCFLRLFSDRTLDYEDRISCNAQDVAFTTFSKFSSVFIEQHTRESWKVRCRWWKNHHFSKRVYSSEIQTGDCKLLASKAACASHIFGSEFQYVEAVKNSLLKQGARDEMRFLSRHMQSSVGLLQTLEKLAS